MEIDIVLKVVALIALLFIIVFVIYVIRSIKSALSYIEGIDRSVNTLTKEVTQSLASITKDVDATAAQLVATTKKLETNADTVNNILQPFSVLLNSVYFKIAPPIMETANYISAISKAVSIFTHKLGITK